MSEINETEQPTAEDSPVDPPVEPDPEPSTEPPLQPAEPFFFQPYLWYSGTSACGTNACRNYNIVQDVPMLYSNNGSNVVIYCGVCSKRATILSAALLDPQPPEE